MTNNRRQKIYLRDRSKLTAPQRRRLRKKGNEAKRRARGKRRARKAST